MYTIHKEKYFSVWYHQSRFWTHGKRCFVFTRGQYGVPTRVSASPAQGIQSLVIMYSVLQTHLISSLLLQRGERSKLGAALRQQHWLRSENKWHFFSPHFLFFFFVSWKEIDYFTVIFSGMIVVRNWFIYLLGKTDSVCLYFQILLNETWSCSAPWKLFSTWN